MTLAIIDYGSGNLRSASRAFQHAAPAALAQSVLVTSDPERVRRADRVVLPGVGAFGDCAAGLRALPGMVEALTEAVHARGVPFFGICVGMQLMAEVGHEYGRHEGLGWLPGEVSAIEAGTAAIKVPHMGWNELRPSHPAHPVLAELGTDSHVYFVHSYAFRPARAEDVLAWSEHGGPIAAFVGRDNMIGAQFHPEKSQAPGLQLIANFWAWTP